MNPQTNTSTQTKKGMILSLEEYELNILFFWFGTKPFQNFDPDKLVGVWNNIWFVKGKEQANYDNILKKRFEEYFNVEKYKPNYDNYYSLMAHLILYDQISRNIFRGSYKAYEFDHLSQKIVEYILDKYSPESMFKMNIQCIIQFMLCMCHTEDKDVHTKLGNFIKNFNECFERKYYKICKALSTIVDNHSTRIFMFGRLPERNIILGRKTTKQEKVFLDELYY
jgi:uncharacterized protein (DUF924 family)